MPDIRWKLHLKSSPQQVFKYLSESKFLEKYWAEKVTIEDGFISFEFINGWVFKSKILKSTPNSIFEIDYSNTTVRFELNGDENNGTDLELTNTNIPAEEYQDMHAGWLSVLMALKAAVDFDIDLRNHDNSRSWDHGYVDN